MEKEGVLEFLSTEGSRLVVFGILVFALAFGLVAISQAGEFQPISYSDVASLIIAAVALTSLYIAWRELIRKTRPNITVHFDSEFSDDDDIRERMILKVTNSGVNVVVPINAWYGFVRREGDTYIFSNREQSVFTEDGLSPGETAAVTIGDNITMLQLENVNVKDWTGGSTSFDGLQLGEVQRRINLINANDDLQVKVQQLFEVIMNVTRGLTVRIEEDELLTSDIDEIAQDRGWVEEGQESFPIIM